MNEGFYSIAQLKKVIDLRPVDDFKGALSWNAKLQYIAKMPRPDIAILTELLSFKLRDRDKSVIDNVNGLLLHVIETVDSALKSKISKIK